MFNRIRIAVALFILPLTLAACGNGGNSTSSSRSTVVATVRADNSYAHVFPEVAKLLSSPVVGAVVEGKITDIQYKFVDQLVPETVMTLQVEQARGDVPKTVQAYEFGGLIPVSAHSAGDRARFGADVPADGLVDYAPVGGAKPPVLGQQVVLALLPYSGGGPVPGAFSVLDDAFGRFVRTDDGDYERAGTEPGYDRVLTQTALNAVFLK